MSAACLKLDELTKDVKEILPTLSSIAIEVTSLSTKADVIQSFIEMVKIDTDSRSSLKTEVLGIKVELAANSSAIGTFQSSISPLSESVNSKLISMARP
ncbi:hypothetical protein L6452_05911 [Arctium lappa]|uniref:Uncharacterized protein n=1 Tax=Arctium lappa TaxID=4217 RepID=A0ACB9EIR9_ARCLA|nr:hypothetical protein L6452_05911 [Arctium lappa]